MFLNCENKNTQVKKCCAKSKEYLQFIKTVQNLVYFNINPELKI